MKELAKLYVIYDRVAGQYQLPTTCKNDDLAIRTFDYVASTMPMVANDLELYAIGEYDYEQAVIVNAYDKPVFIKRYTKVGE